MIEIDHLGGGGRKCENATCVAWNCSDFLSHLVYCFAGRRRILVVTVVVVVVVFDEGDDRWLLLLCR